MILYRTQFGWNKNGAYVIQLDMRTYKNIFIPKEYIMNWNEDSPPQELDCKLPLQFIKKHGLCTEENQSDTYSDKHP
jgi:hypothetical protein